MALFIISDLTHYAAWGDLLLSRKNKHSLLTGGNLVVVCKSIGAIGTVVFNDVKRGGVDVAWTLCFCFCGVTHEWMSSVFIIKVRGDECSCQITCRWCMSIWRRQNRFLECWSGWFWSIIFGITTNLLSHGDNE